MVLHIIVIGGTSGVGKIAFVYLAFFDGVSQFLAESRRPGSPHPPRRA